MRRSHIELFTHLVWSTVDREPLVVEAIERLVYRCIESEARSVGCDVLALNGMPDHVHLVVRTPSRLCGADLAKKVKGVSSTFARDISPVAWFGWQDGYGAFSISPWDVARVVEYVQRQKQHHAAGTIEADWEKTYNEVG